MQRVRSFQIQSALLLAMLISSLVIVGCSAPDSVTIRAGVKYREVTPDGQTKSAEAEIEATWEKGENDEQEAKNQEDVRAIIDDMVGSSNWLSPYVIDVGEGYAHVRAYGVGPASLITPEVNRFVNMGRSAGGSITVEHIPYDLEIPTAEQ